MKTLLSWWGKLGDAWCRAVHDSLMWPAHGHYECRVCGRRRPVVWEAVPSIQAYPLRPIVLETRPNVVEVEHQHSAVAA